jgi:hypothetical protein
MGSYTINNTYKGSIMQFVLDFKNSTTQQDLEAYLAANGLTVVKDFIG